VTYTVLVATGAVLLTERIQQVVDALKMDGVDYEPPKVEAMLPLSLELPRDIPPPNSDENSIHSCTLQMHWSSVNN
jgi:hypothetical protein